ncbi:MAG: PHP domain-containing protein [Desulfovibrio sp.]|nr:PHP domain-containing protein [Desulfovibrio sp.]
MQRIDLHTHTTFSDGTQRPEELVALAREIGLSALAITDHDTCEGVPYAVTACSAPLRVIRGCELSATTMYGELHILGLFIPDTPSPLDGIMARLREKRKRRNERIVEKLCALGLPIAMEEVLAMAGCGTVGRPHIARLLFKKGYVVSLKEAFTRYIGKDGPAFVPKEAFSPEEAVSSLARCGATVCLAHPFLYHYPESWLFATIKNLMPLGLDALEVWHTEHSDSDMRKAREWAQTLGLGESGGSDYHGLNKPGVHLGKGRGNLRIGIDVLFALEARRRAQGLAI